MNCNFHGCTRCNFHHFGISLEWTRSNLGALGIDKNGSEVVHVRHIRVVFGRTNLKDIMSAFAVSYQAQVLFGIGIIGSAVTEIETRHMHSIRHEQGHLFCSVTCWAHCTYCAQIHDGKNE